MPSSRAQEQQSLATERAPKAGHVRRTPACTPPQHTTSLTEVGFWADPRDPEDGRPSPSRFVDKAWGATVTARAVALYVRSGFLESFELGYSFCRICKRRSSDRSPRPGERYPDLALGCCTLTDGDYLWPEGLAHYISEHAVRPPPEFVAHAIGNLRRLRTAQSGGRLRWCPESDKPVPLEPETAVFLRDRTTLGIALPPEPEVTRVKLSDICSCRTS